jgi:hypothetical protein
MIDQSKFGIVGLGFVGGAIRDSLEILQTARQCLYVYLVLATKMVVAILVF